jgi:hypothetical protein
MKIQCESDLAYQDHMREHVIDCDVSPQIPKGWKVKYHIRGRPIYWDKENGVNFFLSESQKGEKTIIGHELQKELTRKNVMNANVLDHWLAHPDLIPVSCKGKFIFFWGTIYFHPDGSLCVRFLRKEENVWYSDCRWLGSEFDCNDLAALID